MSKRRRRELMDVLKSLYSGIWEEREYPHRYETDGSVKCDPACREADGEECVCPCKGQFHAGGGDWERNVGKVIVTETIQTITRWHPGWTELMWTSYIGPND